MSQGQPSSASTVLLIEADPSLRRLITLGLQHQQMRVLETGFLTSLSAAETRSVDLLVLDVDSGVTSNWLLLEEIQAHPHLAALPIVVLAWEYAPANGVSQSPDLTGTRPLVSCLPKPFDARALYREIGHLLAARASQQAALEAKAEEILLASYASHAAPSIWPVITAAGVLLAVIGILLQSIVVVAGLLLVMVALLLWNLGARPESPAVAMSVGNNCSS